MNTSKKIPKKIHARLLVGFFTILMLFNFIAPTFGVFVAQKSTLVYAQEPPAEGEADEVSNVPCYDPPKSDGIVDRGLDIAEGIPIVGGGVGAARAVNDIMQDPLKWFVCGVSEMLTKAIDFINVLVSRLMLYDPTKTSEEAKTAYSEDCSTAIGDGGSDGIDPGCADAAGIGEDGSEGGVGQLKSLWRNVLNVVNIVLVLAMLIMVISSALDFGIFSNYTIKKTLPKIVVAAIAANLSWVICSAVITGINYVGIGIQQVMISPLTKNDGPVVKTLSDIALANGYTAADTGSNMGITFQGPILLGIGGLTWVVFSSMGVILLPLAAIVLTAVIVAFMVLLLRRILLILLVMLAPIAFVAWALPGGEGIFKKWWKSFTQLLLIYPYAMILMGAGVVVSSVIGDTGGANFVQNGKSGGGLEDLLTAFLMLLAMVLPYILLPTAFKAISGVLGTLTGMMNDKGKGLIDRARNTRDNSGWAQNRKRKKDSKVTNRLQKYTDKKYGDKDSYLQRARNTRTRARSLRDSLYGAAGTAQTLSVDDLKAKALTAAKNTAKNAGKRGIDDLSDDEKVWRAQAQQHGMRGENAQNATVEMSKKSAQLIADQIASNAATDSRNNGGNSDEQLKAANAALEQHANTLAAKGDQIGFNQMVSKIANNKGVENLERLQMQAMANPQSATGVAWQASSQDSQVYGDRKSLSPHLNAGVGKINTATGMPETVHEARASAVEGASAAELASMNKESWQAYHAAVEAKGGDPVAAIQGLEAKINAQESTRAIYKGAAQSALATPRRGPTSTGSQGTGVA